MEFTSRREKQLWWATGVCLGLIYSSLYIARPIAEFLRERNLLRAAVGLIFVLVAVIVVSMVMRWQPGWRVYLALVVSALLYVPAFVFLPLPEERLHFVEYGLFCGLVHAALMERRKNRPLPEVSGGLRRAFLSPVLLALILTLAAGWLDEGIQKILPNRYYDIRDVALNFLAGILVLMAWKLVDTARQRDEIARLAS